MVILTILILPIQARYIFPSFCVIFNFFHQCLTVLEYRSFASLGRFIPRYFINFDVMINGIVSLISLSDILLLAYRNATNFCILVLYPVTLWNSLIKLSLFADDMILYIENPNDAIKKLLEHSNNIIISKEMIKY